MKLTKSDRSRLLKWGHRRSDLKQIEEAMNRCSYTKMYDDEKGKHHEEYIIATEAMEILGEEVFLSGISRAAFHWTSCRESQDGAMRVYFDCSVMFR